MIHGKHRTKKKVSENSFLLLCAIRDRKHWQEQRVERQRGWGAPRRKWWGGGREGGGLLEINELGGTAVVAEHDLEHTGVEA